MHFGQWTLISDPSPNKLVSKREENYDQQVLKKLKHSYVIDIFAAFYFRRFFFYFSLGVGVFLSQDWVRPSSFFLLFAKQDTLRNKREFVVIVGYFFKYLSNTAIVKSVWYIQRAPCHLGQNLYYWKDRLARTMQKWQGIHFHSISDKYATNV